MKNAILHLLVLLLVLLFTASLLHADAGILIPRDKAQPDPAILSLKEMEITIRIDNGDARVFIRQIFANHTGKIEEGNYIFALPSQAEGFGLVYLEAMACCKPVIGGAHGGAPEVIIDGVTGYLVQHGDAPQLSIAIETLLSDPALAREMGARGCQRVEHEFRFSVFAKALKKILREQCES